MAFWNRKKKSTTDPNDPHNMIARFVELQNTCAEYSTRMMNGMTAGDPRWYELEVVEEYARLTNRWLEEARQFEPVLPPDMKKVLVESRARTAYLIPELCATSLKVCVLNRLLSLEKSVERVNVVLAQACAGGGVSMEYLAEAAELSGTVLAELKNYAAKLPRYRALADIDFSQVEAALDGLEDAMQRMTGHMKQFVNQQQEPVRETVIDTYAPLVRLTMAMAHADGVVAPEEEGFIINFMRHNLDLPDSDLPALRGIMNEAIPANLGPVVEAALALGPDRDSGRKAMMSLLLLVAQADNVVLPEEVQFLREVSLLSGWNDAQFESFAEQNNLQTTDPWEVLGVPRNASWSEVRKAFRTKMASYHPDKMAQMPPEFQMLAHKKCAEFNSSKEAIRIQLGE